MRRVEAYQGLAGGNSQERVSAGPELRLGGVLPPKTPHERPNMYL
jgi:hypothetical protein